MRLVLVALLIACNGEASQRDAEPDASQMDAEPDAGSSDLGPIDGGEGDGFDHCPPASAYLGDPGWGGVLHTGGAIFCAYPQQFDTPEQAIAEKLRVKLVSGSFAFPLDADGAAFRIPACIEDDDTEIRAGTASASRRTGIDDDMERYYLDAMFPLSDGGSASFTLRAEIDQPAVDLEGSQSDFLKSGMRLCLGGTCDSATDRFLAPCRLTSNTCDRFTFDGGSILIDQFHWAGPVGSGFAAGVRARGELDGVPFDIDEYAQMTVTFGHHAFTRGLTVFFDAPIGSACGLQIEEIAEFSTSGVHLLDCDGARTGMRGVTAHDHRWRMPCD